MSMSDTFETGSKYHFKHIDIVGKRKYTFAKLFNKGVMPYGK